MSVTRASKEMQDAWREFQKEGVFAEVSRQAADENEIGLVKNAMWTAFVAGWTHSGKSAQRTSEQ